MAPQDGGNPSAKPFVAPVTNDSLRELFTRDMLAELEETFDQAAHACDALPSGSLPVALKSLGMTIADVDSELLRGEIHFDRFLEIVSCCMRKPAWASREMNESYALFDKECTGNIGTVELRNVFTRLGENLLESELRDQLQEFDMDGDLLMAVGEYYKMIATTRGSDFAFEDSGGHA